MTATDAAANSTCSGAVFVDVSDKTSVTNSLFFNNTFNASNNETAYGCAVSVNTGGADLFNNTLYNNTLVHAAGPSVGAAIMVYGSDHMPVNVYNNIMLGNLAGGAESTVYTNNGTAGYATLNQGSNLTTGAAGTLFSNAAMGDFTLKSTASDAIDKGSNAYASGGVDLAGNARIGNATVDIGAYEYSISLPTVTLSVDNTTIAETGGERDNHGGAVGCIHLGRDGDAGLYGHGHRRRHGLYGVGDDDYDNRRQYHRDGDGHRRE